MYEELVNKLRRDGEKIYNMGSRYFSVRQGEIMLQAADAIEKLADIHVGKWIPVTERLPAIRHNVLIMTAKGGVAEGEYTGDGWVQYRWSAHMGKNVVTHWMPLPTPPKEET